MGRTTVRKYLRSTDAQAVWKEYSDYMTTSSKGTSEKRRLTRYVTNSVLDNQFRGTTTQFVLHFNEQFGRLDELTDPSERMPDSIKMALLQNAVKDIPQLSIVETLDEYTSTTSGMVHSLTSTTHPLTISSSMHVLGMMLRTHQPLPREEMYMLLLAPRISPLLTNPTKHSSLKT